MWTLVPGLGGDGGFGGNGGEGPEPQPVPLPVEDGRSHEQRVWKNTKAGSESAHYTHEWQVLQQ